MPRLHLVHQSLKCRAIHVTARNAAIVLVVLDQHPAFIALTGNIGLTGVALCIQRVEVLLKPLFARLARTNCAAGFVMPTVFPSGQSTVGRISLSLCSAWRRPTVSDTMYHPAHSLYL